MICQRFVLKVVMNSYVLLQRGRTTVIPALLAAFLFTGCVSGGFDSVKKVNTLQPGMDYSEVVKLLGEPETAQFVNNKRVATFWLHQQWRGNVPMDLEFSADNKLISWRENSNKFAESQNKLATIAKAIEQSGVAGAAPKGPNDPQLQGEIAGKWWGYASSTERRIGLCADGTYMDYTEAGYSGSSSNQYGDQTMAWGSASQGGGQGR